MADIDTARGISDEVVDAAFESLVREVDRRTNIAKLALHGKSDQAIRASFDDLCRVIRAARMEFTTVLKYYGHDYDAKAQDFVESVIYAASLAHETNYQEVKDSIARHAEFVQNALSMMRNADQ
ncbi:MAG: hypothetical protein WEB58_17300 [Planctomycetaceae bacterium]